MSSFLPHPRVHAPSWHLCPVPEHGDRFSRRQPLGRAACLRARNSPVVLTGIGSCRATGSQWGHGVVILWRASHHQSFHPPNTPNGVFKPENIKCVSESKSNLFFLYSPFLYTLSLFRQPSPIRPFATPWTVAARAFCPRTNTGVGCHFLPSRGSSDPGLGTQSPAPFLNIC